MIKIYCCFGGLYLNILLVDDDVDVVDGMLEAIDFNTLGFDRVMVAHDGSAALHILKTDVVNVMVTDIEMPSKSGIQLLEWVRDNKLPIVTIFCTCYADFNYAKKAVELHSFDYFLKPISYSELTDRLKAAGEEVRRIQHLEEYQKYLISFSMSNLINQNEFWKEYLTGSTLLPDLLIKYSDLDINKSAKYMIEMSYYSDPDEISIKPWKIYGAKNISAELTMDCPGLIECSVFDIHPDEGISVKMLTDTFNLNTFIKIKEEIAGKAKSLIDTDVNFYIIENCTLEEVPRKYKDLINVFESDILRDSNVVDCDDFTFPSTDVFKTPVESLEPLIAIGNGRDAYNCISDFVDSLVKKKTISKEELKVLRIDTMQMLHGLLNSMNMDAHNLFSDHVFDEMRAMSLLSVKNCKMYLSYIINVAAEAIYKKQQSQSVIAKVTDYIKSHLDEDLTRPNLSNLVFLNSVCYKEK
jgi:two-component system response regulator YesN